MQYEAAPLIEDAFCPEDDHAACHLTLIDGVPHLRLGDACGLWRFTRYLEGPPSARLLLDAANNRISYLGREVSLTRTEFRLAAAVSSSDSVCSYAELAHTVWGRTGEPDGRAVRSHLRSIRLKLRAARLPDQLLECVRGKGLRLAEWAR